MITITAKRLQELALKEPLLGLAVQWAGGETRRARANGRRAFNRLLVAIIRRTIATELQNEVLEVLADQAKTAAAKSTRAAAAFAAIGTP